LNWEDQIADNRVARGWGEAAMLLQAKRHEQSLRAVMDANPPVTGADLWAGIDCDRGYHPMPFLGGILDKARLPKFSYYMFASQRPAELHVPGLDDGPMVFIASLMEHFSSRDVTVFSNCQKVRLWREHYGVPDELVGEQNVVNDGKVPHAPLVFTNALKKTDAWRLKAQGLIDGKIVAEQEIGAPGVARKLSLRVDRCGRELVADGSDIILIYATIQDKHGNTVPFDDRLISFSISGAGKIVGNAAIGANPVRSELGIATLLVQSTPRAGKIIVRAQAQSLTPAEIELESQPMTEGVVPGRDVGKISTTQNETGKKFRVAPVVMPDSQVMEEQRKSQNLRNDQK
jgi:beta-galactosidase